MQTTGSTRGQYGLLQCSTNANYTGAVVDIVFVHGLFGNRIRTWSDKKSGIFWPQDLLPSEIEDARIMSWGYDADIVNFWSPASQNRVANHAQNLANDLAQFRMRTNSESRPLIFVAHSLGGLICQKAFMLSNGSAEDHIRAIAQCTRAFAFLGVPHCGADLAKWGVIAGNFANLTKRTNTPLVAVLQRDSEVLADISQGFNTAVRLRNKFQHSNIDITCYYEELAVSGAGTIVPKESAILPAFTPIGIRANHMDMTKFQNQDDRGFRVVADELWRWTRNIRREGQFQSYERQGWGRAEFEGQGSSGNPQRYLTQGGNSVFGNVTGDHVMVGNNISGTNLNFGR